MTDENSLYSDPKQPDEFRTESPLRAFAEYTEYNGWMIAKGFRPSMQHLVRYLAAMESREGYRLVQILEAATGVPTMIFRTTARAPLDVVSDVFKASELSRDWKGHPVGHIDPEKEKRAQELFDRNFGKSNATFSGPPGAEEIPDVKITFNGLDPEKTHWSRAQWNGDPDDAIDRLRRGGAKARNAHVSFLAREGCDSVQQYWQTASVASMLRLIDFLEMWDEVSLADFISDEELYKAIGRAAPDARAACNADPMAAIEHEVTSQSPVDVLETMAEGIADDLGIEVDRDSFQVAREHLEELVDVTMTNHPDGRMEMKFDDPLNPQHYNGRECADIGERLSANGYQILKYCWRLGKKDDPCQELGKALWYLDSEAALMDAKGHPNRRSANRRGISGDSDQWVYGRLNGQSEFTRQVALFLWDGYSVDTLPKLKAMIADHRATLDCGHGLAI